ncbi:5'-nucleotidase C-terminal domain-containing protein [Acinetobacter chinensis]|uniref:5'-nucleotidase C-terminal domain-containing protein n=1 Tax=Acinetobacter chinensis TaxID=2004650 RepID=A0ABU3WJL1_9GAMM|nr:5'-nucleotidase C-terminal domain-containing protein [Acinetobacter chinensis]MDV2470589.1 5'-nucleotidase C-terminal domain-containing protein [Acinetobacter chinensis]
MLINNKKQILALSVISILLTACNDDNDTAVKVEAKPLELNILHINDHHSHLDEDKDGFALKANIGQGDEDFNAAKGGFARVTALINQIAAEKKNIFKMHVGDATTGDLYYNLTDGKADADAMNTVCFDTFTPGNHEFDAKDDGLKKFIDFLDQGVCKDKTKILTANVTFGASSPLYKTSRIQKSQVFEKDGVKFAIIGLTVAKKTKNSSQPNADTLFADEIVTAQKEIDQYKAQGIKNIILQTHVGYDLDQQLAQSLTDVDVIIGGDSHTLLGPDSLKKYNMTPEGAYPTQLKNKDGNLVCVAQAWQYSYIVGELNVKFDKDGKIVSCAGTPHLLLGDDIKRTADIKKYNADLIKFNADKSPAQQKKYNRNDIPNISAAEKAIILNQIKADEVPFNFIQPDAKTLNVIQPYQTQKQKFAEEVVGQATDNLCSRRVPGTQRDVGRSSLGDVCNKNSHVDQHGGDIQQIIAEAFLQQGKTFFNADISFQNGGGVREDVALGDVSVGKIYNVLPFKNTLLRLDMTGAEVKATLEDAIDGVIAQNNTGSYPYTGGLRWNVDFTQNKGQRLSQIQVSNATGQYENLDLNKTYKVITIDFLANGGDYYTTLKNITGERRVNVGLDYAEAFLKYAQALSGQIGQKKINKLATTEYSTQLFIDKAK